MAQDDDRTAAARRALIRHIERLAAQASRQVYDTVEAPGVLDSIAAIPREQFVPTEACCAAYHDEPLAIGYGQTISQPFIVALMTGLLRPNATQRILEIGTGSGYQAAVLSRLVAHVYSIEIVAPLAERAKTKLAELGVSNVSVRVGDGHKGWPEAAPFDGIIVTAAADAVPEALVSQLAVGGRLVIPLGTREQMLVVIERHADGTTSTTNVIPVRFVPFVAG